MEGRPVTRISGLWRPEIIEDIQVKTGLGRYRIRGFGTMRRVPSFEDLVFIPASLTRVPLEGYRERCETETVIGTRFAKEPLVLSAPVMISGMSFGALSRNAKIALAKAATLAGVSTTTGDGGMTDFEREHSARLIVQVLPSRYGLDPHHLVSAEAVEVVVGQGAKPGTGGLLLGQKVSPVVAEMRDLPEGVDQRSAVRHPDWIGADDLVIKIEELRSVTDGRIPIIVKLGATRVYEDVKLAVKAGADAVLVDGMEGGTAAAPDPLMDHTGIPTLAAVTEARRAIRDMGVEGEFQLIIAGGIRNGVDAAKALALGADAVAIGTAALIALNCNRPIYTDDYRAIGAEPYACHHCHTGLCPVGIATQDPNLEARLDPEEGAERVANFLYSMIQEIQLFARACGKSNVHNLDREDLRALTVEAAAMAKVPLAGTEWIPGAK
ncbi:FMN-binding glutamate synthase family protein [Kyrpidia spormannii]|uniref:Glutamate synthase large subunit-like protein n=2 Tax=Kyrpidia spormannii TaxID=2055160 RepID=A0ACA8ZDR3_9BACL|nr:FMN-binding glutamate synthase family protein [Kyrpidia spormannii]CAB3395316.1 Glutamate synthase large subunit-like protein [Kyrpidia spormannii]CAB3396084.1 Glutamate synthase large subunit-like protein [Kyrpidia spormannii]